jgi:hypothetical protein
MEVSEAGDTGEEVVKVLPGSQPLAGLFIKVEGAPVEVFSVAALGAAFVVAAVFIHYKVGDTVAAGAKAAGLL